MIKAYDKSATAHLADHIYKTAKMGGDSINDALKEIKDPKEKEKIKAELTRQLDEYEKIQYNNVFDQDNKNIGIFYLEGYEYIEPEIYSEELINKPQTEIKDIVIPEADLAAEENTLAEAG